MTYHVPVLLEQSVESLQIKPNGVYVDLTFGGGGHSKKILEKLGKQGKLIAFDMDSDAEQNIIEDKRLIFLNHNFRYLKNFLKYLKINEIDGVLADLGVSSYQFDTAEKGFSTRFDSALDMRMDKSQEIDARYVVNKYEKEDLIFLLKYYGEVSNAAFLANKIIENREKKEIVTTSDLRGIAEQFTPSFTVNKYLAKVFQAIRIEVNQELESLRLVLQQLPNLLVSGGRVAIISYHSLEDRLVKNFFRSGNFEGKVEKDFYGNIISNIKPISAKPIIADESEINENPRARSAKLRVAEKI